MGNKIIYSVLLIWFLCIFNVGTALAIISDDFNTPALNTSLWAVVNPKNDATFSMIGTGTPNASITILVPGGTSHDVWNVNNAPRIMQAADNTNFEVEVKFLSRMTSGYQIQGVIVQQDSNNYLRFDFVKDSANTRIFAASFIGGTATIQYDNSIIARYPLYLKIKRIGNQWTQYYSYDGITYTGAANFNQVLTVTSIGPFAGNAIDTSSPSFTGLIDYFFNTSSPIVPEDVPQPPIIIAHPISQTVAVGQSATFTVTAEGTAPLTYQWQRNGSNIPGATNAAYITPATSSADNGATFRVLVTNSEGNAFSNYATLTVLPATSINIINNPGFESGTTSWSLYTNGVGTFSTTSPGYEGTNAARLAISNIGTNTHLFQGGIPLESNTLYRLSFIAYSTSGNDLSIALIKQVSPFSSYGLSYMANLGTSWQAFSTEFTTKNFAGNVSDGYFYFWPVAADTYYIDNVRLEKVNVLTMPTITTQPADHSVYIGQPATFSVVATGTAPLTYQWQKNGMDIPGAISASYTTPTTTLLDNISTFRVLVTNPLGSIMSNIATLTVLMVPPPASNLLINGNFESGTLAPWGLYTDGAGTPSIVTPGYEGNYAARFAISNIGTNTHLYQGAISGITPLEPNTRYRLSFVAYSATGADLSIALIKQVSPYSNYGLSYTPNLGTSWQAFSTEFTTKNFAGNVSDGYFYFWPVAADTYYIDNVRLEKVNVLTKPTIATQPADQNVDIGQPATFSVVATGTAPLTYQWQKNGTNIPGATGAIYTIPATTLVDNGATFRVNISNAYGSVVSNNAALIVIPITPVRITAQPSSQTVDIGQTATFSVEATGTAPLNYQWQKNGTNIDGAISASYTTTITTSSDNGSTFRVLVTNPIGTATSNDAILTVLPHTSINLINNPGFESGTTSWLFYTDGTGTFTASPPGSGGSGSAAKLVLSSLGTNMQLYQTGINLEPNSRYRLSFAAYSTMGHGVNVNLIKNAAPYPNYGLYKTFNLVPAWQTFTTEFTTSGFTGTVNDGKFLFWLPGFAAAGETYYFDDVRLEKVTSNDTTLPNITLWYGNYQKFGQTGVPQQWVNILGNVYDISGIASLNYSLNNGVAQPLSIGPDGTRLQSGGDFNIEINHLNFSCGNNQVVIKAADYAGNMYSETVSVEYSCNKVWPVTYSINWSDVSGIQEAAQVVDGLWTKEQNSIRPTILGYDRLIDIGDMGWDDYEVTVPITINAPLDPSIPWVNVGIIMRWQGHYDWNGDQPRAGWYPIGALGLYIWAPEVNDFRLRIFGNNLQLIADDTSGKHLSVGVPYMFKMRAETIGTNTRYSLKVWEQGTAQPPGWTISGLGIPGELKLGSAILMSHYVDASFGNVTIRPVWVNSNTTTPGITTQPSNQTVNVGQAATFSVVATGIAPLAYHWQKNGKDISGATNAMYTTLPTTLSDNGSTFRVNVTNSAGSVMSTDATLTVTTSINIINNWNFESGKTSWVLYTNGVGTFNIASPGYGGNNAARLDISNIGTNTHLYQSGITIEPNTRYRFSFTAYSLSGNDIKAALIKQVSPFSSYGLSYTANLGTGWQTFTTEFTTPGLAGTVNDGYLYLWPVAEDTYYIDNVRLEKV